MTLEERILQTHKSVMSFAKENNIPYTTMKGIITRGLGSTSIQTAIQICNALQIELEPSISGKITPIEHSKNYRQKQLIMKYELLDTHGKKIVDFVLDEEYARCTAELEEEEYPESLLQIRHCDYKVSAGHGFEFFADEEWDEIEVPDTPEARKADFALTIQGDSMEPVYYNGDIVLVRQQNAIDVGQIGIFVLNGAGYIKKNGGDRLISLNEEYDDILIAEYDDCRCVGKVIGRV